MNRNKLTDRVDALYNYIAEVYDAEEEAWQILKRCGADESEADTDEGFFGTMSDADIQRAADMLEARFFGKELDLTLHEEEIKFILDSLSSVRPSSGSEAKMIELITDKLS